MLASADLHAEGNGRGDEGTIAQLHIAETTADNQCRAARRQQPAVHQVQRRPLARHQMDWAVLTFDPSVTKAQRDGIVAVLGKLYPVKWNSFTIAPDQAMTWVDSKTTAVAKLDDGKAAEVSLKKFQGMTNDAVVIKNLKYWGAPRNDGFIMMPNTVEAYRLGDKAFEFKGTNGFMITYDIKSTDIATATPAPHM